MDADNPQAQAKVSNSDAEHSVREAALPVQPESQEPPTDVTTAPSETVDAWQKNIPNNVIECQVQGL